MLPYILPFPASCSCGMWSENIDNWLAKTSWFQHGRETDPNFTPKFISIVKITPPCTMTVPTGTKYTQNPSTWCEGGTILNSKGIHLLPSKTMNIHLPIHKKVPYCFLWVTSSGSTCTPTLRCVFLSFSKISFSNKILVLNSFLHLFLNSFPQEDQRPISGNKYTK